MVYYYIPVVYDSEFSILVNVTIMIFHEDSMGAITQFIEESWSTNATMRPDSDVNVYNNDGKQFRSFD